MIGYIEKDDKYFFFSVQLFNLFFYIDAIGNLIINLDEQHLDQLFL